MASLLGRGRAPEMPLSLWALELNPERCLGEIQPWETGSQLAALLPSLGTTWILLPEPKVFSFPSSPARSQLLCKPPLQPRLLTLFPVHHPSLTCCFSPHQPARESQECKTAPLPGTREMCVSLLVPRRSLTLESSGRAPAFAFPSPCGCTHHWVRGSSYLVPDTS